MRLSELLKNVESSFLQGGDIEIKGICYDSRKAEDGFLFVAIKGLETDGHNYAAKAVELGAVAVLCQDENKVLPVLSRSRNITIVKAKNTRAALGSIANVFYDDPSSKMLIIGVTGTNGKTTTTYLLESIFKEQGMKTGIIGTIENKIGDVVIPTDRTTPESLELAKLFAQMYNNGVSVVAMEVSSHSLDLHRVDFCKFDIGIFTNLTQDHLDYHGSMESYREAKAKLFSLSDYSVINVDDSNSGFFVNKSKKGCVTYGINRKADLLAENISITSNGVDFTVDIKNHQMGVCLLIPGKFTVYNALGAIGAALFAGVPISAIKEGLRKNSGVAGRAQSIKTGTNKNIIVDYAHTPDGLANILDAVNEFATGRVITVFGCGGNRDKKKRPLMGEIAGQKSGFAVITSDNPRNEEPASIIDEVEAGMLKTDCKYVKIVDRRDAINYAVKIAEEGDVVVIAGKGHENYQIFADKTIHFDDAEVAMDAVKLLECEEG